MKLKKNRLKDFILFTVVLLTCILTLVVAAKKLIPPENLALLTGTSPAILSQMGTVLDPSLKILKFIPYPYTGFQAPPYLEQKGNIYDHVPIHYRTNNQGFLTKYDLEPFKSAGLRRSSRDKVVVMSGGSAVWGWGATSNQTIAATVLEDLLNRDDPQHDWHVINLAMGSWIAYQEFLSLDIYGYAQKPDWVVTVDGRNDVLVPTLHGEGVPNYYFFRGQENLNRLFESTAQTGWRSFFPIFRYFELSKGINAISQNPPQKLTPDEREKAVNFYLHTANQIAQRFSESKVLIVTQPTTFYYEQKPGMGDFLQVAYDAMIRGLKDIEKAHKNMTYANGLPWFQHNPTQYLHDDCHFNDLGHRILAENLLKLILKN